MTRRNRPEPIYSDLESSFSRSPVSGSLVRVVDEDSVRQSIRNIVLTSRGEWPHHPTLGSKATALLFEPLDDVVADQLVTVVRTALDSHEPRARIHDVSVVTNYQRDGYELVIQFSVLGAANRIVELREFLRRVR